MGEWTFYMSLAQQARREAGDYEGLRRHCVYVYIPPGESQADIDKGVDLVKEYLLALADQIEEMDA